MKRLYEALYRVGVTPWDSARIPGPLVAEVQAAAPGIAVDLGCGTGSQARYLAANGWSVTAVDFVPRALAMAAAAGRAGPGGQKAADDVTWRLADVTQTAEVDPRGALAQRVSLILDNGCMHGIAEHGNLDGGRNGWARTVEHLAAPGCVLLVRTVSSKRPRFIQLGPVGTDPGEIAELLERRWRPTGVPAPGWSRFARDAG
jgi:SAM-dependent methyltransferase